MGNTVCCEGPLAIAIDLLGPSQSVSSDRHDRLGAELWKSDLKVGRVDRWLRSPYLEGETQ